MDANFLPFNLRDALLCLGYLIGMGVAVSLIVRKQVLAGALTLVGFVLFSLDPIAEVIIFQVLASRMSEDGYPATNWVYACISGPAIFLGVGALTAALIVATRSTAPESLTPPS